jgi:hypothetical protein
MPVGTNESHPFIRLKTNDSLSGEGTVNCMMIFSYMVLEQRSNDPILLENFGIRIWTAGG